MDGTYTYNSTQLTIAIGNDGTSSANKNIFAVSGAAPIIDFSGQPRGDPTMRGLTIDGNFWHVRGLTITKAGDNGIFIGGNGNTVELCTTTFNMDTGIQLSRAMSTFSSISQWPSNNLILDCESHDNADTTGENADGIDAKLTSGTGNTIRGCICHNNSDDGYDDFTKTDTGPVGAVTYDSDLSYNEGVLTNGSTTSAGDKNGFKLGGSGIPVNHTITRCIAFNNTKHNGITDNDNPGSITVTNNTSFGNLDNFNFRTGSHSTFTNNVSLNGSNSDLFIGTQTGTTNVFWVSGHSVNNGGSLTASSSDFESLTPPPGGFTRNSDGSINLGTFAHLAAGSDLINAGTPSGTDIGAVESF